MRLLCGLGLGLLIALLIFYLTNVFVDDKSWVITITGIITSLFYFLVVFPHVTFTVPANRAWIMVNRFISQDQRGVNAMGFREIQGQKEFQAGFHWKFPWDYFEHEEDMQRRIDIKSDPDQTYTLKGGQTIVLKWQIPIVPLPGHIVNFNRTHEDDIKRRVKTRAEGVLQGYIGEQEKTGFGDVQKKELEKRFENLYGGPGKIDDEEREMGIWTGTPEVYDIGNPKEVEDSKNLQTRMNAVGTAAKELVGMFPDGALSPQDAMKLAFVMGSGSKVDFLEISGILGNPPRGKKKGGPNAASN